MILYIIWPKSNKRTTKAAPSTIINRRARFDYQLGEEVVAGLVLTGPEVRAARETMSSSKEPLLVYEVVNYG